MLLDMVLQKSSVRNRAALLVAWFSVSCMSLDDTEADLQATLSGLATDAQCTSSSEGLCALSALQSRGLKTVSISDGSEEGAPAGSCLAYGCGRYDAQHSCQCNPRCVHYRDCCTDYWSKCIHTTKGGSCLAYGCTGYSPERSCQCNSKCTHFGNCCSDYWPQCAAPADHSPHPVRRVHGHPRPGAQYPVRHGFTLMLVEEFTEPLDLDRDAIWTWSDGGLKEGQTRFDKEQIKFKDGKMIIEMADFAPPHVKACSHAEKKVIPHKNKVSGELRTKHNMFRYGFYEARIKAPYVQPGDPWTNGNFVSTMFVFRDGKFKHWREIDIEITGDTKGQISTNVLKADDRMEWAPDMEHGEIFQAKFNARKGFQTYAFEWLPNRVRWFVDGHMIREWHGKIPEMSAKIVMNLWMFEKRAAFGGKKIWNDRFPMSSEYDWFRFYKWDGDKKYPCPSMGTECLTEDDWYLSSNNPCDGIRQTGTIKGKGVCTATCGH